MRRTLHRLEDQKLLLHTKVLSQARKIPRISWPISWTIALTALRSQRSRVAPLRSMSILLLPSLKVLHALMSARPTETNRSKTRVPSPDKEMSLTRISLWPTTQTAVSLSLTRPLTSSRIYMKLTHAHRRLPPRATMWRTSGFPVVPSPRRNPHSKWVTLPRRFEVSV